MCKVTENALQIHIQGSTPAPEAMLETSVCAQFVSLLSDVLSGGVRRRCSVRFVGDVRLGAGVRPAGWGSVHWTGVPRRRVRVHRCRWVGIKLLLGRTRGGQDDPSDEKQRRRRPADVDGRSQLPLLRGGGRGALIVCDGRGCRPADRDQEQDCRCDDGGATRDHGVGAPPVRLQAAGALGSDKRDQEADESEDEADDDQRPGGLQVLRHAHDVVGDLTLHLTRGLHHAPHPQSVPDDLTRHDVGPDVGGHPPHGDPADHRCQNQA